MKISINELRSNPNININTYAYIIKNFKDKKYVWISDGVLMSSIRIYIKDEHYGTFDGPCKLKATLIN